VTGRAALIAVLSMVTLGVGDAGAQVEARRTLVGSGGGRVEAGTVAVTSSIGQPAVGYDLVGDLEVTTGFWGIGHVVLAADGPAAAPSRFFLAQNAPNPFRSHTVIRYGIPEGGGAVRLRIFDAAGRHVRTLVDGDATPGFRSLTWDRRDAAGRPVGSGIYFYTLDARAFRDQRKLTVLR